MANILPKRPTTLKMVDAQQNIVMTSGGYHVNLDDYADEWHIAHPDDELPPRRARTKAALLDELSKVS